MAAFFLLLAVLVGVVLGDALVENESTGVLALFGQETDQFTEGQLLLMFAGLGVLFALLLVLSVRSTRRQRARRKDRRSATRELGERATELERDNARLRDDLAQRDEALAGREAELAHRDRQLALKDEELATHEQLARPDQDLTHREEELARREQELGQGAGRQPAVPDRTAPQPTAAHGPLAATAVSDRTQAEPAEVPDTTPSEPAAVSDTTPAERTAVSEQAAVEPTEVPDSTPAEPTTVSDRAQADSTEVSGTTPAQATEVLSRRVEPGQADPAHAEPSPRRLLSPEETEPVAPLYDEPPWQSRRAEDHTRPVPASDAPEARAGEAEGDTPTEHPPARATEEGGQVDDRARSDATDGNSSSATDEDSGSATDEAGTTAAGRRHSPDRPTRGASEDDHTRPLPRPERNG